MCKENCNGIAACRSGLCGNNDNKNTVTLIFEIVLLLSGWLRSGPVNIPADAVHGVAGLVLGTVLIKIFGNTSFAE